MTDHEPQRLRDALIDTAEKGWAYQHDVYFRTTIDTMLLALPGYIEAMARLGLSRSAVVKDEIAKLAGDPKFRDVRLEDLGLVPRPLHGEPLQGL